MAPVQELAVLGEIRLVSLCCAAHLANAKVGHLRAGGKSAKYGSQQRTISRKLPISVLLLLNNLHKAGCQKQK
jgi:hypothetical protein